MTYDPNGNVLTVRDPRNLGSQVFTYDTRNRVHTYTDPVGNMETYNFDGVGNLTSKIDRKNQTTSYTYDGLNRPTAVTYADGSSITITWDAGNRPTQFIDTVNGTISRQYDDLDRLTEEVSPQGQVDYEYDAAGRRTRLTVSGLPAVTYQYDDANRLTQIAQGATIVALAYDAANRRTGVTLPNGIVGSYSYDDADQLLGLNYDRGATHIGDLAYTYDQAGRRITQSGSLSRLTMPPTITSASYDPANRLTSWGGTPLTYDSNGNLTTLGSSTYSWNNRDQLVATSDGGGAFSYDAFGRRTTQTVSGATVPYLYDGANPATLSGSLILNGLGLDDRYAQIGASATTSFLTDALGSTLAVADDSGSVLGSYAYGAYGATSQSGSASTPFQYTGRENDGTTGLFYFRSRYYSPGLNRFISEDPACFAGGFNWYAYVAGDPISNIDPFGLAGHLVLVEDGVERTQWLYDWAQSYQPSDFNTVVIHGTADGRFAESPVASGTVAPDIIAQLLKASKGYDPKLPTQLVACSAGSTKTGAQALANALGATVFAATQILKPGPTLGSPPVAAPPPNTFWGILQLQTGPAPPINWIPFSPKN